MVCFLFFDIDDDDIKAFGYFETDCFICIKPDSETASSVLSLAGTESVDLPWWQITASNIVGLDRGLQMAAAKVEACSLEMVSTALSDCSQRKNFNLNCLFLSEFCEGWTDFTVESDDPHADRRGTLYCHLLVASWCRRHIVFKQALKAINGYDQQWILFF